MRNKEVSCEREESDDPHSDSHHASARKKEGLSLLESAFFLYGDSESMAPKTAFFAIVFLVRHDANIGHRRISLKYSVKDCGESNNFATSTFQLIDATTST